MSSITFQIGWIDIRVSRYFDLHTIIHQTMKIDLILHL